MRLTDEDVDHDGSDAVPVCHRNKLVGEVGAGFRGRIPRLDARRARMAAPMDSHGRRNGRDDSGDVSETHGGAGVRRGWGGNRSEDRSAEQQASTAFT